MENSSHGRTVPALLQRWYDTPEPTRLIYLVTLYENISRGRKRDSVTGEWPRLDWMHLAMWSQVTGDRLLAEEVAMLFEIDDRMIRAQNEESKDD